MSQKLVSVARAAHLVDSFTRKPEEFEKVSFFGLEDIWRYNAVWDVKLCDRCLRYARSEYYVGRHLRGIFEYLEIVDEDVIHVRVHPHCRCYLSRVTDPREYIWATAIIWEYS